MSDWPDPNKPGMPLNPERDGWHWIVGWSDKLFVAEPSGMVENGWTYAGPVLTPPEADALRTENARLREALAFYVRIRAQPVELVKDFGNTAEAPLEWKP